MSYLEKLLDGAEVVWLPLGEVGIFLRGNGLQKKDFSDTGVGCIHYGQIYTHYGIATEQTKTFVSEAIFEKAKKAEKGDLIIADTSENDKDLCKAVAWLGDEEIAISNHTFIYRHSLNPKYVSYFLQTEMFYKQKLPFITGTKVRSISAGNIAKIKIPIPCPDNPKKSLAIQAEIVRILDAFTELTAQLTAELTAELTARKKQYTYYRNQLLTFDEDTIPFIEKLLDGAEVVWLPLGDERFFNIANKGRNPIKASLRIAGETPYYGANNIQDYVYGHTHDGEYTLIAEDGSASLENYSIQYANGQFWANNHVHVVTGGDAVNTRYLYHYLSIVNFIPFLTGGGRAKLTKGKMVEIEIPIPCPDNPKKSLAIQAEIVRILDKFNALTNSIQEGLPREIELRQKQYEYYRDVLLNFPKPTTEAREATV